MSKTKKVVRACPTVEELLNRSGVVAAAYGRESPFRNPVEGFGMGAQKNDYREFCRRVRWPLADDVGFLDGVDENASGSDWDRKALNSLIDAAEAGRFDVIVAKTDRWARNMTKRLVVEKQLRDLGVPVVYTNLPLDNQGTAEGNMLKNTLLSFAEHEREAIAFRTARGLREKAQKGLYAGAGPTPSGSQKIIDTRPGRDEAKRQRCIGLEIVESLRPVVQRIFRLALTHSLGEIADVLEVEVIPAPGYSKTRHSRWYPSTIREILVNPTHQGTARYGGVAVPVPPIVSEVL